MSDSDEQAPNTADDNDEQASSQREAAAGQGRQAAEASSMPWLVAGGVTIASSAATFQAFRPDNAGQASMLITLGVTYALLTAATAWWLHRRGELKSKLAPHRGDIAMGALIAVGMYLAATGVHILLTSRGSPKEAWLIRVYLQIGDPQYAAAFYIGPIILLIGALEEVVWRGWVLTALLEQLKPRQALLITTALYGLAHASTVYLLRDPYIGLNPLVLAAALGCGLVWGWLTMVIGRVSLSVFAHALFTWSVVEFPIMNM